MAPENVRDVVSPVVFHAFQIFGYALFAFVGVFLCLATRRAILDARSIIVKFAVARSTSRRRPHSLNVAMPSAESPVRAMPARVIAFAPRSTRNRVVVR